MILKATKYVHLPMVLAKNELIDVVDSVDLGNTDRAGLRYFLEISVRKAANSAEFVVFRTLKGSEKPPKTEGGATYFEGFQPYIDEYLNGLLAYVMPDMKKPVLAAKTTTAYKLRSWAERDGVLVGGSEVVSSVKWAIKAALGENDVANHRDSFFSSYMDANMPWLTHQPNGMRVGKYQNVILSWLCNLNPMPSWVKVASRVHLESGQKYVVNGKVIGPVSEYGVYHIPVGYDQLGFNLTDDDTPGRPTWDANAVIVMYEVWLEDNEGRRVTEIRNFRVDGEYYPYDRTLIFSNSLGGFDSVRFTGEAVDELSLVTDTAERATGATDKISDGNVFVINKKGERALKLSSGTIAEPEWLDYLEELAWAELVYLAPQPTVGEIAELVPLVLKDSKYVPRMDGEDIGQRGFEFVAAKNAVATNALPYKTAATERPTVWIPKANYCMVGADGKQTGYAGAAKLELHYSDVQPPVPVKGVALKDNDENTEGYVQPVLSSSCAVGYAAFTNAAINRLGTYKKTGCEEGFSGVEAMISVASGLYGGSTLKAANDLAEAEWTRRNTQAAANANGAGCVLTIENYTYTVPGGKAHFRWNAMRVGAANSDNYVVKTDGTVNKGNGWPIFVTGNPDIYVPGTNDIDLPVAFGAAYPWQFGVYGKGTGNTTVTIYVDGTVVATQISGAYFFGVDVPHGTIVDGSRVYIKVS
jgi:hypothetical protein